MTNKLIVGIEAGVATVELNRPEAYNTLNVEMLDRLPGLLTELADDGDTRCVVITGTGDKAFCSNRPTCPLEWPAELK